MNCCNIMDVFLMFVDGDVVECPLRRGVSVELKDVR